MIELFLRKRITTLMVYCGVCLLGVISVRRLPVQLLPDIEFPKLTVVTPYENAAPAEIEQLVTRYIEEAASSVNGVVSIYSESMEGLSLVTARFEWGTNMDLVLVETKEKADIAKGQLPQDAGKSIVVKFDPKGDPVMIYSITSTRGDFRQTRKKVEKELLPFLERTEGVALVDINGGHRRQINVDLDSARIYAHSLSLSEVLENIDASNHNFPAGNIEKGDREYLVRTLGEFGNMEEIRSVAVGKNEAGTPVYLADIADIGDGFRDRKCIIRTNGEEAVGLLVRKEPGKNTIETCDRVKEKIEFLRKRYGAEFGIDLVYDQSEFIRGSIDSVVCSAVFGAFIAFILLWFVLKETRSSLIIATSIPISVLGTFTLMYFSGISLNSVSLGGLALGTGMMVDAGIVVLDSIAAKRTARTDARAAKHDPILPVLDGVNEVKAPVIASILTSIVVFLPILFLSGITGAVFRDLALTVSFALICSMLSSFTLIPMLSTLTGGDRARRLLSFKRMHLLEKAAFAASDRAMDVITLFFNRVIRYAMLHHRKVLGTGAALCAIGGILFLPLPTELMPAIDPGEFTLEIAAPGGTPLAETCALSARVEKLLLDKPYTRFVYAKIGSDPEDTITDRISGTKSNAASIRVVLKRGGRADVRDIIASLKKEIRLGEGVRTDYRLREDVVASLLGSPSRPLRVELYGKDSAELARLGKMIQSRLGALRGVSNVGSSLDGGDPELRIRIDREYAAALGLSVAMIASTVRAAVSGEVATRYREKDDEIDLRVRLRRADRAGADALYKILVKTDGGATVPLAKVITLDEGTGTGKIIRSEQSPVNLITADIEGDRSATLARAGRLVGALPLPAGYEAKMAGDGSEIKNSSRELLFALGLAVVLVYMVLASQFQSLARPLVVMLSLPVAAVGVSGLLLVTGKTLNINSGIGIVLLAGTVVNNAIVLLDFIDHERRRGATLADAVVAAGHKRMRPILLTTGTTVFAMLPIALGIGEGAELQQPMAVAVIGGLSVSTALTLVFIPTVVYRFDRGKS